MEKSIRPSKRIPRNRILKQLETFAATPDIRYGDSLRKVKEQYPRMLNSLRLPSEPADVRAAMILSRAGLDINAENLSSIKELDGKFMTLENSFHPKIALSLIMEGRNPLDMTVEDIQAYIDSFGNRYGRNWRASDILDTISGIEPIIRSSIIGLYKALRLIRREEGAGLGFAMKSGNMAKLGAFLSAVSNINEGIDFTIDDTTSINEPIMHENSVRAEIARACAYSRTLLTT